METVTLSKKLNVKKNYDVIVCGGGVAGVAAAVTAANNGNSVLIIEKSNILGGLATLGLVNLFVPMCNGNGKQIIFGLCEKWARLSAKYGYDAIPKEWQDGEPKEPTNVRYIQRYSPYVFALQLTEEITSSGARDNPSLRLSRASDYFDKIKKAFPQAKIVYIFPTRRKLTDEENATFLPARKEFEALAREKGIYVIDGFTLVPHLDEFYADGLHPNPLGFSLYAENLASELKKLEII